MCLVAVAWRVHPHYPLILAGNRDEFHARPAAAAAFWPDQPDILAGRDLEAGGSWLGVSRQLRFAALTNFREGVRQTAGAPSRGALVSDFLAGRDDTLGYLQALQGRAANYAGFNLFVGDHRRLGYYSNRGVDPCWLPPGIYGLSNHLLDTPWPKLTAAKRAFSTALRRLPTTAPFFDLLADREIVADPHLPQTGVSLEWERVLSAIFVNAPTYGTRASTLLAIRNDGLVEFTERSFGPEGVPTGENCTRFQSSAMSTDV